MTHLIIDEPDAGRMTIRAENGDTRWEIKVQSVPDGGLSVAVSRDGRSWEYVRFGKG